MKTTYPNPSPDDEDDLESEYTFDYTKAKPNRFAMQDSQSKSKALSIFEMVRNSLNGRSGKAWKSNL
jgi:hypothetical protein